MNIAVTVVSVGVLVFLAHVFAEIFSRKKIPDVLLLIVVGLIVGPLMNIISIDDFGMIGPVFTTITLVTILFEGGTELKFDALKNSLKGTSLLTNLNFFITMIVVGLIGWLAFDLPVLVSLMLGSIVGGTSSAVVIPLVRQLEMGKNSRTVLILESAFSDVLCIVFALAFMEAIELGQLNIGLMIGNVFASFILATLIGLSGAFFWSMVLHKIRNINNSIFTTPAFVFIIFGISELLGYSGAISALAFGIGLANMDSLASPIIQSIIAKRTDTLNETERVLFSEIVFLLKTFFFVYIGISIRLDDLLPIFIGFIITLILFIVRVPIVRASMPNNEEHKFDLYYMSAIVPKGLAAAVLATIPLQRGIVGGEFIMNLTFSIVLFSIVFTSVLVPLVRNNASVRRVYEVGLNFSMLFRVLVQKYQKARKEKKLKKEAFEKEPLKSDYDTVISELNASKEEGEIKK
jgi:potassium/hydrogen antiporter